jgi:hypothetical protein
MKPIFPLYLLTTAIITMTACKKDLLMTKLGDKIPSVLSSSLDTSATHTTLLAQNDSAVAKLTVKWTEARFLDDTSNGKLALRYIMELDTTNSFSKPVSVVFSGKVLDTTFTGYELNTILLGIGCTAGVSNRVFVRVKATETIDTLVSNVYQINVTPYTSLLPLQIQMPAAGLYILGNATTTGWNYTNIIAMAQIDYHTYQVTLHLAAGQTYNVLGNATGNPWISYVLPGGLNAGDYVWGGSFIENSAATGWPASTDLLSPAATGTYTITFDFVTATFKVTQH